MARTNNRRQRPSPAGLALMATLLLATPTSVALAQEDRPESTETRRELQRLEAEIRQLEQLIRSYSGTERTILGELDRLDRLAQLAQRELAAAEARLALGRSREQSLTAASRNLESRVAESERRLRRALVRIYKQGASDWLLVALGSSDPGDARASLRYLAHLSRGEEEALLSYRALRAEAAAKRTQAEVANRELEALRRDLEARRAALSEARGAKRERLSAISARRERSVLMVREREEAAAGLRELLQGLAKPEQSEAATDVPTPVVVTSPSIPFSSARGALVWPVDGTIKRGFGTLRHPRFNTTISHTGLALDATAGEPVKAAHEGTVVFRDWFKAYGQLVILDHDDGYYTLYAHLQQFLVAKGEHVSAGQPVGLAGETGSLDGVQVYFEIRRGGEPVNPRRWLRRRP